MGKRDTRERTTAFLAEPENWELLIDFIVDGGTLSQWTTANKILYRLTYEWIHGDRERKARYEQAQQARADASADLVRDGLRTIGKVDPRKAFNVAGNVKSIHDMPDDVAMSIASFEVTTDREGYTTTKIKMNDRLQSLALLGRSAGVFRDRLEVTGNNGGPVESVVGLRGLSDADLSDIKSKLMKASG